MKKKILGLLLASAVALSACAPSQNGQSLSVEESVQATLAALTAQAAANASPSAPTAPAEDQIAPTVVAATETATETGGIAGALSFPSEFFPAMTIVAFKDDGAYYYIATAEGQSAYQLDNLPVGDYRVVAYTTVVAGQIAQNIDPQDWYAPQGYFPPYPLQ